MLRGVDRILENCVMEKGTGVQSWKFRGAQGVWAGGQPLSEVFPHKVQHPCSHMCAYQAEDASLRSPVRPTSALGGISWVIFSQTMNQAVRHGLQPCAKGSAHLCEL